MYMNINCNSIINIDGNKMKTSHPFHLISYVLYVFTCILKGNFLCFAHDTSVFRILKLRQCKKYVKDEGLLDE